MIIKNYLLLVLNKYIKNITIYNNEIFILVTPNNIFKIISILSKLSIFQFKQLIDINVIDYPERTNRFEIIYHLLSITYNVRINIRTYTNEKYMINSIMSIYKNANWSERECWDMFGIYFKNHEDLRRILTDYGFNGYPLRKDFPLTGYKEIRYDDSLKHIVYERLSFAQEYRNYDYTSSWQHIKDNIK
uniref:NADH dehydrogenase subunit 9 n=1 Tax=Gefionella okellyi TaxID=2853422 RepID=A0A0B5H2U0_9EUKA|nr:NADH dehydrogenase subunit 9 [Gefionella okellyi]